MSRKKRNVQVSVLDFHLQRIQLLQLATGLVKTHGFTRAALAESVLLLPLGQAHPEPLSDTAVSSLFGNGDDARRTLIHAWLDQGIRHMGTVPSPTLKSVLHARLQYNEPVLQHLPEVHLLLFWAFVWLTLFLGFCALSFSKLWCPPS